MKLIEELKRLESSPWSDNSHLRSRLPEIIRRLELAGQMRDLLAPSHSRCDKHSCEVAKMIAEWDAEKEDKQWALR